LTKYVIEALVILVFVFAALSAVLVMVLAHKRRTVRVWQSPAGLHAGTPAGELPAGTSRVLPRRAGRPDAAGMCCLEVPCSAACAQRQQTKDTAAYLSGVSDTYTHPNRIRQLIHEGDQLGYQDSEAGDRRGW
jgi:hypothetical protein